MIPRTTVEVHEISSSDNDSEEGKDHGKAKLHKSATAKASARPSIGPVAIKTMRRGKYRNPTPTQDLSSDDSDSDSSDDSAPFVTSRRVENYIPRAVPLVQAKQAGKQRSRPSAAASKPKPRVSTQPVRLPTPSSDSDSDNEDEQTQKAPTASQIAAAARRFQRFASRDRSPARNAEKGKKKRKDDSEEDRVQRPQKDDTPSRIIRRRTVDHARESSSPARPTKRKAKVIETTDDEYDSDKPGQKRLKSYGERQVELARASSSSQAGTSRRGSLDRSGSAILPVNAIEQSEHKPEIFFVDVEKNVDNLLALPPELEPWEDIFEAAEILNLDTLRDCIGSADNADDFVKWVLAVSLHVSCIIVRD